MVNKKREEIFIKLVRDLFEEFLRDPYLSKKVPSYVDTVALIKRVYNRIVNDIYPAVKRRDREALKETCLQIAQVHRNLQLNEFIFFKEVERFGALLHKYKEQLDLTENDINFWITNCKRSIALVYMENLIEDVLLSLEAPFKFKNYFAKLLKTVKGLIEKIISSDEVGYLKLFLPKCPICSYINSVEFEVKTYTVSTTRLRLENEHKDFHQVLIILLEDLLSGNFDRAVTFLRELVLKIYALDGLLTEIEHLWPLKKWENFCGFLSDANRSNGLLKIVTPLSRNEKVKTKLAKDFLNLFLELVRGIREKEDNSRYLVFLPMDGSLYLYIDYRALDFPKILEAFYEALKRANREKTLLLVEGFLPPYAVGKFESKNFHRLEPPIVKKILSLAEKELTRCGVNSENPLCEEDFTERFQSLLGEALKLTDLEEVVKECLNRKRIALFYQPIVELFSGKTVGVELLARIFDREGRIVPAGFFLEFVEEANLTVDFDLSVLNSVFTHLDTLKGLHNTLFVNIFPNSLSEGEVINTLLNLLEEMERRNMQLVLELTEHTVITNKDILERIEKGNLKIAFDDFGSGYTNFKTVAMLAHRGRTSFLKVDGELVREINLSEIHEKVVETIADFGCELGLGVIFEHISDREVLEKVKQISQKVGLKEAYGQGFYLGKPQPVVDCS